MRAPLQTYDEVSGVTRLGGYFSLSVVSVERATVTRLPELDRLPRFLPTLPGAPHKLAG